MKREELVAKGFGVGDQSERTTQSCKEYGLDVARQL